MKRNLVKKLKINENAYKFPVKYLINLTDLADEFQNINFNKLAKIFTDEYGLSVTGEKYEDENGDQIATMYVYDPYDLYRTLEDEVVDALFEFPEIEACGLSGKEIFDDFVIKSQKDFDEEDNRNSDNEEIEDDEFPGFDDMEEDEISEEDNENYKAVHIDSDDKLDEDEDLDECDTITEDNDTDIDECDTVTEDEDLDECDKVKKNRKPNVIKESKASRFINRKRKRCNCNQKDKKVNLYEALKFENDKDQRKYDKSVDIIKSIINDLKSTEDIDTKIAKKALAKLKRENEKLKELNANIEDIPYLKATLRKLKKIDPTLDIDEELGCKCLEAYNKGKKSLHENVKLDGKSLSLYNYKELQSILKEAKEYKSRLLKKYSLVTESINSFNTNKILNNIHKVSKFIEVLDEELSYRSFIINSKKFKSLFENEDKEEDTRVKEDDKEDNKVVDVSTNEVQKEENKEDVNDNKDEKDETSEDTEVELSGIIITVKDKDAADELIKTCVENGIPEDVLEIVDDSEKEEKENEEQNESYKLPKYIRQLFEDADTDSSKEEDKSEEDTDEDEDEEETSNEPVQVKLTDTDYANKLQEILDDEYGISKEEFEEKIGGQLIDDTEEDKEKTNNNEDKEDKKEDDEEDPDNIDIDPKEIFSFDDEEDNK